MNEGEFSIQTRRLRKVFEDLVAVDDIDLAVKHSSITALLGGNGAGKSTTLAMLLGLLEPTAGAITLLDHDLVRERAKIAPFVNFSSPYVDLPNRLTVRQNLTVYGHLYVIPHIRERVAQLAEQLQIADLLDRRHGSLSAGQKTRATLAKALLNEPRILLLDEPTASLDPDIGDWVRTLLVDYRNHTGATIFMASHNMVEVERMCDDVIIMRRGKIVDRGTPAALLKSYSRETMEEVFLDIARHRASA